MTQVAVAHAPLGYGGGERVCFTVLEALQDLYDVTLITDRRPDITEYNAYYGTDVDTAQLDVQRMPRPVGLLFELFPGRPWKFKQLVVNRYLRTIESEFGLLISTVNEYDLLCDSVQYIHYPMYPRDGPDTPGNESLLYAVYDQLCSLVYTPSSDPLDNATLLTNSDWTASVIESAYGESARVVYPPVQTPDPDGLSWEERENGFVTIGRLAPEKRILKLIDLVVALTDRDHDLHYHIAGPRDNNEYARQVERKADEHEYIHLEGKVSTERLAELRATHRYGLHGMENEHFGIVVAEMAAAGMIVFTHASGGQQEILGDVDECLYSGWDNAVETIESVLNDRSQQARIRKRLTGTAQRFSEARFQRDVREAVSETLAQADNSSKSMVSSGTER